MVIQLCFTLCMISPVLSITYLSKSERWTFGLLTSICLGMVGFIAAIVLVQLGKWLKTNAFKACIKFFFSLACATLLGDAMIHILAEAYADQHLNGYYVSLIVILSIVGFLVLEKIFVKCGVSHEHWVGEDHHHHSDVHNHQNHQDVGSLQKNTKSSVKNQGQNKSIPSTSNEIELQVQKQADLQQNIPPVSQNFQLHQIVPNKRCLQSMRGKGIAGYLNIIGSTIHNTIDGLSIGLAFSAGVSTIYVPVVVAIFIHQIPRELGDVAILLKSKFTNWQTICSNGLINLLAVVGAIIGLSTNELLPQTKNYIMVFVAGNFIYIASDIWRHLFNSGWKSNLLEGLGFTIGIVAMFAIKTFDGDEELAYNENQN